MRAIGLMKYEGFEKAIATFDEMIGECKSVADADKCELAAKVSSCFRNAAEKRGIDPKKGIEH